MSSSHPSMRQRQKHDPVAAQPLLLPFAEAVSNAFGHSSETWGRACLDWQTELGRFAARRIEGDVEVARLAGECRSISDLADLHRRWATEAWQAYAEEARLLMRIFATAAGGQTMATPQPVSAKTASTVN